MQSFDSERLIRLRDRRAACDLSDGELGELYGLEMAVAPNPYGQVVAVLSSFPPYLYARPHLIAAFVGALWPVWNAAFRGQKSRVEFERFLASKGQVDDDLGAALLHHRAEFDAALDMVSR